MEKKGCRYLIEAFRTVRAQMPQARLVIAGMAPSVAHCPPWRRIWKGSPSTAAIRQPRCSPAAGSARVLPAQCHGAQWGCGRHGACAAGSAGQWRAGRDIRARGRDRRHPEW
ncbi:hypothetical protein RAA17_09520 [Komagataeibacter rhaeticus]|nr:hypothetical protein [Komagataeibacter rhaeticus]